MTVLQKITKYAAAAFAVFLAVSIIGGTVGGVLSVAQLGFSFSDGDEKEETLQTATTEISLTESIKELDIELKSSKLSVSNGSTFSIKHAGSGIKTEKYITANGIGIKLRENANLPSDTFFDKVELTVPADTVFDKVRIDMKAGSVQVGSLTATDLDVSCDAGSFIASKLFVSGKADIDIDAGNVDVKYGEIGTFDCDTEAGRISFGGKVKIGAEIDSEVGSVRLALVGSRDDYTLDIDKSVGSVTVDGARITDKTPVGSGSAKIKIDGGVGSVDIVFGAQTE